MSGRLEVRLLGEQSILGGTSEVFGARSSRAVELLAYLIVHAGTPVARQHLAGVLWPDSTDAQSLTNLRRELHHLRQLVGDDPCLVVTTKELAWRDSGSIWVDVRLFAEERQAALRAWAEGHADVALGHGDVALAAYRGELLPGSYDDWVLDARAELHRACVELCAVVAELRAARAELPKALEVARRRVRLEPLEEAGYRAIMEIQAELGDRAGAISTYHRCASLLERELGVTPDRVTRTLLERLMGARGAEVLPGATAPHGAARPPGRLGPPPVGLVGRPEEFAVLDQAWQRASDGHATLVVVRGSAGVGKTALATAITAVARQAGAVVASSQCFGTGRLALAPVADWLRDPHVQSATAGLDAVWGHEVDRLVPSGADRSEPSTSPRAMVDAWQKHRFFEGLARALLAVARPALLVLDNVQWCDEETLAFVAFLLGLDPCAPLLVTATLRTDDDGDNQGEGQHVADWLVQMRATGALTELTLRPLEPADTARLAETIARRSFGDEEQRLLQAATGGFPLHIVEAMRDLEHLGITPIPEGDLAEVLRRRLEQTSPTAREIAGLAAAVGRDFALDLLVEASDLDADSVVHAVDELWRRRIVHEHRTGYHFSHELIREAAYRQVTPAKRWLLHRRIAQGLELLHYGDTDSISAQLAEQYGRGGRPDKAIAYYRRAAEVASEIFAHAEAIRLYSEALALASSELRGRESQLLELAILEAIAAPLNARYGYASSELQEVLERSIELAQLLGRRDSLLNGWVALNTSRFVQGRIGDARQLAAQALELVDQGSEHAAAAHFAFAGSTFSLGRPAEALHHFELAAQLNDGVPLNVGTRPDVHGRAWAAHAHWLLGHDDVAMRTCDDAIARARVVGHPYSLAVALAYAAITHQMHTDRGRLAGTVAELHELCGRYGFAYYSEWALVLDGWCRGGEEGLELAHRGIVNLKAQGAFTRMPYWLSLQADLLRDVGRADDARSTLDAAASGAQARSDLWWLPEVQRMRALSDPDDLAVARLLAAADLASAHGSVALARRCEYDLAARGVRMPIASVASTA